MIDADERELQHPAEALLGAQSGASRQAMSESAQTATRSRVSAGVSPGNSAAVQSASAAREVGHPRRRQADELRALDQRVAIALGLGQQRIEQPFAQAQRREHHLSGASRFSTRSSVSAADGRLRARRDWTPGTRRAWRARRADRLGESRASAALSA